MKCPACQSAMVEKNFGGVHVDVCENGCKGMWFDWMELVKLDESSEGSGQALIEAMQSSRENTGSRGQIPCPQCGTPMRIHNYGRAQDVKVDECYACGGFFLDSGELHVIRGQYMSDAEYAAFTDRLVNGIPGAPEYQEDLERRYLRAKAALRMTRYMRPSYIVPKVLGLQPQEEISVAMPRLIEQYRHNPSSIRTPEMKAYADKYMQQEQARRTPEQCAFIDEFSGA